MAIKNLCPLGLFSICLMSLTASHAQPILAGETIQIYTEFHSVIGKPSWLLILRDMNTGQVLPYLYDIRNNYNFWLALPMSHNYRVTVSTLTWGPFAVIHNFCHLQDGILSWRSLNVTLKGNLTPDRHDSHCYIQSYKNLPFPLIGSY